MILKQFYLGCLAHASYIVVDERTKTAVVVDPQRDVEQYLEEAKRHGAAIRHVILTHFHADFISGHLELRERTGAQIHLGRRAEAEYAFSPLADGEAIELGDVRLQALETPGHTPEAISILVFDLAEDGERPKAVFTGDTLFVGDVGRPDLMASKGVTSEELAGLLYDSLRTKLLTLPDETLVYPAHGAGSMCGKSLGKETFSTIGEQRRLNYALQPMTREEFVSILTADLPSPPAYFGYDAELNRRERATLEQSLERVLRPLTPEEVLRRREAGAELLDVRPAADFAAAHLAGAVNVGLEGSFATWCGTLLDREKEIVIVAPPGKEHEAAMRLGRIGLDGVAGYLEGGMAALAGREEEVGLLASTERIGPDALAEKLADPVPPLVLDVRTAGEWAEDRVEGSLNVPLASLEERLDELPADRELAVLCRSGYRSSAAASLLARHGRSDLLDVAGGFDAWKASGLDTEAARSGS